jgi:hypothetical protein
LARGEGVTGSVGWALRPGGMADCGARVRMLE